MMSSIRSSNFDFRTSGAAHKGRRYGNAAHEGRRYECATHEGRGDECAAEEGRGDGCAAHKGRRYVAAIVFALAVSPLRAAPPYYDQWVTFGPSDGLPSDKAFCVAGTSSGVWVGTDSGLARYVGEKWRTYGVADGLAHVGVLAIAEDPATHDVWIATMGGLNRYSAGRFDTFNQLNSGLAGDVVYGLAVHEGSVWAATAAGTSRYDIARDRWTIFDETNTPMHERWCYSAAACGDRVYLGVWGGGLLEYDRRRDRWRDYRDPDGEMEIVLFRDDGILHDVVASVACDGRGIVWVGTYFGLSRYDGRKWRNFMEHDSPLASNFVNFVTARDGTAWIATDNGLSATDGQSWWVYTREAESSRGRVTFHPKEGPAESFGTEAIFPHNYILGIGFAGDDIWLATDHGVGRGRRSGGERAAGDSLDRLRPDAPPSPTHKGEQEP